MRSVVGALTPVWGPHLCPQTPLTMCHISVLVVVAVVVCGVCVCARLASAVKSILAAFIACPPSMAPVPRFALTSPSRPSMCKRSTTCVAPADVTRHVTLPALLSQVGRRPRTGLESGCPHRGPVGSAWAVQMPRGQPCVGRACGHHLGLGPLGHSPDLPPRGLSHGRPQTARVGAWRGSPLAQ